MEVQINLSLVMSLLVTNIVQLMKLMIALQ
jgi:hypothetical protein